MAFNRESWLALFREARGEREVVVVDRLFEWADEHDPALTVSFGHTRGSGANLDYR